MAVSGYIPIRFRLSLRVTLVHPHGGDCLRPLRSPPGFYPGFPLLLTRSPPILTLEKRKISKSVLLGGHAFTFAGQLLPRRVLHLLLCRSTPIPDTRKKKNLKIGTAGGVCLHFRPDNSCHGGYFIYYYAARPPILTLEKRKISKSVLLGGVCLHFRRTTPATAGTSFIYAARTPILTLEKRKISKSVLLGGVCSHFRRTTPATAGTSFTTMPLDPQS